MMKELDVKKVDMVNIPVESAPVLSDEEKVVFQPVSTVDWAAYPYCPGVRFHMAYMDNAILIHYKVKGNGTRTVTGGDNGPVWEDSCVEFFSVPTKDGVYYSVECNCTGCLLIGAGAGRNGRRHALQEVLDEVQRWSSLGREDLEERVGECSWEVALVIPYSAFFMHNVTSLGGKTICVNFYKYSNKLQTPRFLSWSPIDLEKPNFHCPELFGELHFG